jgi:ribosomal protein S18 acetylase RimI-like enzyme
MRIRHNRKVMDSIRQCSAADLARLLESAGDSRDALHHRERFGMQEAGTAVYLLAWRGDELAGWCTVLTASKYGHVRQVLGVFPEMNALEARPQRHGTGTKLITYAENIARARGATLIGLAVEVSNHGARRLYERLGYRDWGHGLVIDQWNESHPAGTVVKANYDPCHYLSKVIG